MNENGHEDRNGEHGTRRKRMSLKQLAANRLNARKSIGPKTTKGKAVAKMNAVKHGILSREVVVRGLHIKESQREYAALHQRFFDELEPVGPVEEMLVDQIVTAHWRLRRALTAESGEIALNVDNGAWKRDKTRHPQLQWMEWEVLGDPVPNMENSAFGNRLLERWLTDVQTAVERLGGLTEAIIKEAFGERTNSLTRQLDGLRLKLQRNPDGLGPAELRERNHREVLTFLKTKLSLIQWRKRDCEEYEDQEKQASRAAAVLPSMETLEKIMRYETKLERQIYRAMAQLERLQRMRKGETLPAPVAVISDRL